MRTLDNSAANAKLDKNAPKTKPIMVTTFKRVTSDKIHAKGCIRLFKKGLRTTYKRLY
jgi:hypothetical protein